MEKRNYNIYAVDFDGTLCENAWPDIGKPNHSLISTLKKAREKGDKVILWTCRTADRLDDAIVWCKEQGLEFDAVNENLPEIIGQFGTESRKVFADIYIDDKAINPDKTMNLMMQMMMHHRPFEGRWVCMR